MAEQAPVVVLGGEGPVGRAARERLRASGAYALLEEPAPEKLGELADAGVRVLDLRPGPPQPLPCREALPACALVELGRARLFGARHLALPGAGAAAALLAAQPLLAHG